MPRWILLNRSISCGRMILLFWPLLFLFVLLTQVPSSFRSQLQAMLSPHLIADLRSSSSAHRSMIRADKFVEVPQIIWGLNNQKIAVARAALTARYLNRTLVMPTLSESVFYNITHPARPLPFDNLFSLDAFNSRCKGFVAMARKSKVSKELVALTVSKGSGRRWTVERDLAQLNDCRKQGVDKHGYLKLDGKHPFLWHDHWPVKDYARVFRCLVLTDSLLSDVADIQSKLRQRSARLGLGAREGDQYIIGRDAWRMQEKQNSHLSMPSALHYVAVHMRIERDWMIHCKNTENAFMRKGKIAKICSSKQEIIDRVSKVSNLRKPSIVYLAVADDLLNDTSLMNGWSKDLIPYEKKRLGVLHTYGNHPYTIQAALDYEICLRASIFIGNSYSTFSSLVVLERTLMNERAESSDICMAASPSYAYNLAGKDGGPRLWGTGSHGRNSNRLIGVRDRHMLLFVW
ncbi:hypothetical protein O6H91_04G108500 [Diphasiastrum complanatum]|uniref:Uncharacterized protein n=1 Tax=Diphasiastrum complanatum TaxID=34168 RepID=A0ACC2E0D5_DIPCM|nr:hypothetical protein O6H91_04G108500 [Diphasiastrum complanatum]